MLEMFGCPRDLRVESLPSSRIKIQEFPMSWTGLEVKPMVLVMFWTEQVKKPETPWATAGPCIP